MGEKIRRRLMEKGLEAADRLDLPPVLAPDIPRMELSGNRCFYMDRHRGVLAIPRSGWTSTAARWWCVFWGGTCNCRP